LRKKEPYSAILQNLRGLRGFLTGGRQEKFLTAKDAKGAKEKREEPKQIPNTRNQIPIAPFAPFAVEIRSAG